MIIKKNISSSTKNDKEFPYLSLHGLEVDRPFGRILYFVVHQGMFHHALAAGAFSGIRRGPEAALDSYELAVPGGVCVIFAATPHHARLVHVKTARSATHGHLTHPSSEDVDAGNHLGRNF
ncbi:hypothetical protein JTE90_009562 [Oedothorax gibbosus]|uniref:Uncharacterized protein n=1 Tax=Oedothorax gibbosus TaxID=931172 RepID=A0AAV6V224_9ARAC|nr:hypothetical protein JTE90_009562 [Oedothorax gibbosus]